MSYLVTVTFDLKNAQSKDYDLVYKSFAALGLSKEAKGSDGKTYTLPNTTCLGEFTGASTSAVRDDLAKRTENAIAELGLTGEVFVVVGDDWRWALRFPKAYVAA
ncbi:MAG: hypothetical protein WC205_00555 [Opitutaceae bacterium]|jgi:hypothetical protein